MKVLRCFAGVACLAWAGLAVTAAEPTREELDFFEKEIRPLLVQHCYECHGSADAAEGGLRMDGRSLILKGGATGAAAVLGQPKESLIIEAVQYRGFQMPPNGKLPDADIAKLVRWVEMGLPWPAGEEPDVEPEQPQAPYQISPEQKAHWSFQPLAKSEPPAVQNGAWPRGAIDRFVLSRLEEQGLQPVASAERATLLRRVSYDLTGLPPTPAELHDFVQDGSPQAWERVVERLLASPRYGERWGRHWLDVVRYADTAGDASDYPVPDAWKYRNYVIDSFNNDKPYDQFLREQYAGDLLAKEGPPERFAEQTIATSHLALSRRFGYNDTNFHYFHLTIADTLDTLGQSVLGLSIGCARCHDHKFEPISAKDYYALYGIFASTKFTFAGAEEVRAPKHLIPLVPDAEVQRLQAEQQSRLGVLDRQIESAQVQLAEADGGFETQTVGQPLNQPWSPDPKVLIAKEAQSPFVNVFPAGQQGVRLPNAGDNHGLLRPMESLAAGVVSVNVDFRNVSAAAGGDGTYRICLCQRQGWSSAFEILVNQKSVSFTDGTVVSELTPAQLGQWYNLQLSVDLTTKTYAGRLTDGQQSWTFSGKALRPGWSGTVDAFLVDAHVKEAGVRPERDIDNVSVSITGFPKVDLSSEQRLAEPTQQQATAQATLTAAQQARQTAVRETLFPTAYGVSEGTPANTRLQKRGEPARLAEEVPRGFLEILGGDTLAPDVQESGRRQLAEWITRPTNPLTPRVMANRIWHYHFGRGLVATTNDFGVRGESPSHPELLDYLAAQLISGGWSLKNLHREILRSQTYQLASTADAAIVTADPQNRWLARFQRQRLDAESLRDSLLLISGELDETRGEGHPFPAVETWAFSQHNPFKAVYDSPKRSVYLMTQRIQRHPFLSLFDGADPNTTTGRRLLTTTPTQALFLMNDPFVHQRSTATAQRLLQLDNRHGAQLTWLYEAAYSRVPSDAERDEAAAFQTAYRQRLGDVPDVEVRTWAALARSVFSSNEFLHID